MTQLSLLFIAAHILHAVFLTVWKFSSVIHFSGKIWKQTIFIYSINLLKVTITCWTKKPFFFFCTLPQWVLNQPIQMWLKCRFQLSLKGFYKHFLLTSPETPNGHRRNPKWMMTELFLWLRHTCSQEANQEHSTDTSSTFSHCCLQTRDTVMNGSAIRCKPSITLRNRKVRLDFVRKHLNEPAQV